MKVTLSYKDITKALADFIPKGYTVVRVSRGTSLNTAIIVEAEEIKKVD